MDKDRHGSSTTVARKDTDKDNIDKQVSNSDEENYKDCEASTEKVSPKYQYGRRKLLDIRNLDASQTRPDCLAEDHFAKDGYWSPDIWIRSLHPELGGGSRGNSPLTIIDQREPPARDARFRERKTRPVELERDVLVHRRASEVKERIKEDKDIGIVLSPQRGSFTTGCHVSQTSSRLTRQGSSDTDRDKDRRDPRDPRDLRDQRDPRDQRRVGSGRIIDHDQVRERDREWEYRGVRDRYDSRDEHDPRSRDRHFERSDRGDQRVDRRNLVHDRETGFRRDFRDNRRDQQYTRSYGGRRNNSRQEEEPEWFTEGPTSQFDRIELRGFETHPEESPIHADDVSDEAQLPDEEGREENVRAKYLRRSSDNTAATNGRKVEDRNGSIETTESSSPDAVQHSDQDQHQHTPPQNINMFDFNDLFNMDTIPGLQDIPVAEMDVAGALGSRFSQWFKPSSSHGSRGNSRNNSRRSSLNDEFGYLHELISGSKSPIIPSPTQPIENSSIFTPMTPMTSSNLAEKTGVIGGAIGHKSDIHPLIGALLSNPNALLDKGNGSIMDAEMQLKAIIFGKKGSRSSSEQSTPGMSPLTVSGKAVKTVTELEADLRQMKFGPPLDRSKADVPPTPPSAMYTPRPAPTPPVSMMATPPMIPGGPAVSTPNMEEENLAAFNKLVSLMRAGTAATTSPKDIHQPPQKQPSFPILGMPNRSISPMPIAPGTIPMTKQMSQKIANNEFLQALMKNKEQQLHLQQQALKYSVAAAQVVGLQQQQQQQQVPVQIPQPMTPLLQPQPTVVPRPQITPPQQTVPVAAAAAMLGLRPPLITPVTRPSPIFPQAMNPQMAALGHFSHQLSPSNPALQQHTHALPGQPPQMPVDMSSAASQTPVTSVVAAAAALAGLLKQKPTIITKPPSPSNQTPPITNLLQPPPLRSPSPLPGALQPQQFLQQGQSTPRVPSPIMFSQQPPMHLSAPSPVHPAQIGQSSMCNLSPTQLTTTSSIRPPAISRVPSPQELIVHTQTIMQNALIKKQLEDQKERFMKKQHERAKSPNPLMMVSAGIPGLSQGIPGMSQGIPGMSQGMPGISQGMPGISQGMPGIPQGIPRMTGPVIFSSASPVPNKPNVPANFTPTSVIRKMHSDKVEEKEKQSRSEGAEDEVESSGGATHNGHHHHHHHHHHRRHLVKMDSTDSQHSEEVKNIVEGATSGLNPIIVNEPVDPIHPSSESQHAAALPEIVMTTATPEMFSNSASGASSANSLDHQNAGGPPLVKPSALHGQIMSTMSNQILANMNSRPLFGQGMMKDSCQAGPVYTSAAATAPQQPITALGSGRPIVKGQPIMVAGQVRHVLPQQMQQPPLQADPYTSPQHRPVVGTGFTNVELNKILEQQQRLQQQQQQQQMVQSPRQLTPAAMGRGIGAGGTPAQMMNPLSLPGRMPIHSPVPVNMHSAAVAANTLLLQQMMQNNMSPAARVNQLNQLNQLNQFNSLAALQQPPPPPGAPPQRPAIDPRFQGAIQRTPGVFPGMVPPPHSGPPGQPPAGMVSAPPRSPTPHAMNMMPPGVLGQQVQIPTQKPGFGGALSPNAAAAAAVTAALRNGNNNLINMKTSPNDSPNVVPRDAATQNLAKWFGVEMLKKQLSNMPPLPGQGQKVMTVDEIERSQQAV